MIKWVNKKIATLALALSSVEKRANFFGKLIKD
jgi:hypothetical protein